jgi:hypothetical protein
VDRISPSRRSEIEWKVAEAKWLKKKGKEIDARLVVARLYTLMIDVRIRYNGVRVRLRGFGFRKFHNLRLLEAGLASVRTRLLRGLGSDEAPTKPLTKRYARYKSKVTKRRAVRDLRLTGDFLDNLLPRYADDHMTVAYSRGRLGRMKAILYRDLINFSDNDQKVMRGLADQFFKTQVTAVREQFLPRTSGGSAGRQTATFRRQYFGRVP